MTEDRADVGEVVSQAEPTTVATEAEPFLARHKCSCPWVKSTAHSKHSWDSLEATNRRQNGGFLAFGAGLIGDVDVDRQLYKCPVYVHFMAFVSIWAVAITRRATARCGSVVKRLFKAPNRPTRP
jgi:hypothetical protein